MPDLNERLDLSDYPAPDGYCSKKDMFCVWAIKGECVIPNELYECPR